MDTMYIRELKVFANHGVLEEEKRLGQLFSISLELELDLKKAARSGNLEDTVNYSELCHKVQSRFTRKSYDLIESAALDLAEYILDEYTLIRGVKVHIKKPWAPIQLQLETAEVVIGLKWHKAYIGLGSNMGEKEAYLKGAIDAMNKVQGIQIKKCSSLIMTKPWGYTQQDDFLNAVAEVETYLEPNELMEKLLEIEQSLDRKREIKWGPRTIDLDIIMYEDYVLNEEKVILPHPRMHERAFVLESLNEIAPYMVHPIYKQTMNQLLAHLKEQM